MLRTRRQGRYQRLRRAGMLKFEAFALSRVPSNTPYLKVIIANRRELLKPYQKGEISRKEYEGQIKELYQDNRWLKRNKARKIVADPWRMLREYEDKWRNQWPAYESPWQPRRRAFKDFVARMERDFDQRRGYLQAE